VGLKGFDEAILSLINQCLGVEPLREDHAQTKCHNEVKKAQMGTFFYCQQWQDPVKHKLWDL
jgi:hypothetical protein